MSKTTTPFNYVNEIRGNTARVNLFGSIGGDVNGHYMAQDLLALGEQVDQIDLFINSEGGSVIQGLSIISAITNTQANVTAYIDGMALSMAGVIAVSCDVVKMADFGRFMAHDPSNSGKKDAKMINALAQIKGTLVKIFLNNTKKSALDIDELMSRETWMTPEEALASGFIDEIYTTGKRVPIMDGLELAEIVNVYKQLNTNPKKREMKSITNLLSLAEDATEDAIQNAINELKSSADQKDQAITALTTEKDALKTTNETLIQEVATATVENAIALGKVDPAKKDEMINLAKANLENFKALLGFVATKAPIIANQIQSDPANERESWTFDDWQKKDSAGLMVIKNTQPEKFTKLFNAYTSGN